MGESLDERRTQKFIKSDEAEHEAGDVACYVSTVMIFQIRISLGITANQEQFVISTLSEVEGEESALVAVT